MKAAPKNVSTKVKKQIIPSYFYAISERGAL